MYDVFGNRIGTVSNGVATWTLYDGSAPIMDFSGLGSHDVRSWLTWDGPCAPEEGVSCQMESVTSPYRGIRKSLQGAAVLLIFDVGFLASPLFSWIICPIWVLSAIAGTAIKRPGWGIALVIVAIPVVTFGIAWFNADYQLSVARENAKRVVAACEEFHAAEGRFPRVLDELVPKHLKTIPIAKHCLGPGRVFYYHCPDGDHAMLWYQVVTPHYTRIYHFKTRHWSYLD